MTVSAFIIVHKNVHLARPAVASLVRQTRPPDRAAILVTDADGQSVQAARELAAAELAGGSSPFHHGPEVLASAAPLTCGGSKNWAAALTASDCFFTLDADDYLEPRYVACCMAAMESHGCDAVGCEYWHRQFDGRLWAAALPPVEGVRGGNPLPSCSIIRKTAYDRTDGFLDILYDDWAMWLTLAGMGMKLHRVPERLFTYVRHAAALTQPEKHGLAMEQLRKVEKL